VGLCQNNIVVPRAGLEPTTCGDISRKPPFFSVLGLAGVRLGGISFAESRLKGKKMVQSKILL